MIDVENQIYTPIAEALRVQFPGIKVSGEYVKAPSGFPFVSIVEQDNYPTVEHMTTSETEQFATLMYEVNVYSDKATGKKSQCRSISEISGAFPFPLFPIWRTQRFTVWWLDTELKRTALHYTGGK